MSTKPYVILAPHVDDEVIGCFSLLELRQVSDVFYVFDITPARWDEALDCSEKFGFNAHRDKIELDVIPKDKILMVPSIFDQHPHHKALNAQSENFPNVKGYYSVDMNVSPLTLLDEKERLRKFNTLVQLFPSQSKLFMSDAKYHLFECLRQDDYQAMQIRRVVNGVLGRAEQVKYRPL